SSANLAKVTRPARPSAARSPDFYGADPEKLLKTRISKRGKTRIAARRLLAAERHHQHVAMSRMHRVERHDRRHTVVDPVVVGKGGIEWVGHGEAAERAPGEVVNAGLAALHVDPAHQQDQHPVDTVPMHAFRRRPTLLAVKRLDPELVDLDMP